MTISRPLTGAWLAWLVAGIFACGGEMPAGDEGSLANGGWAGERGTYANASTYAASCSDGVKDGNETAVDCGGSCGACGTGARCSVASDCASQVCKSGYCAAPGVDGVQNGDESDVDCGGTWPNTGATAKCAVGKKCYSTNNCVAGSACEEFVCAPASCSDGMQNGAETDVDCGGSCSTKCVNGKKCTTAADCVSGLCSSSTPGAQAYCRVAASCTDKRQDGDETGVDCGGSCGQCGTGVACNQNLDCSSGVCGGHLCAAPSCGDGVKNGTETAIDCGGSCGPCGLSGACKVNADCKSGLTCTGGYCAQASSANPCLASGSGASYKPAVTCAAPDACNIGVCDPSDGSCGSSPVADGTSCGGAATCKAGACVSPGVTLQQPARANAGGNYQLVGVCANSGDRMLFGWSSSLTTWQGNWTYAGEPFIDNPGLDNTNNEMIQQASCADFAAGKVYVSLPSTTIGLFIWEADYSDSTNTSHFILPLGAAAGNAASAQSPQITSAQASSGTVTSNGVLSFSVTATDPNLPASPISFNWSAAGLGMLGPANSSAGASSISWTAPACIPASGTSVSVSLVDGYRLQSSQTFNILPAAGAACPALTLTTPSSANAGGQYQLFGGCINGGDRVLYGWSNSSSAWNNSWYYAGNPFQYMEGSGFGLQASCSDLTAGNIWVALPTDAVGFFIWEADYSDSVITSHVVLPLGAAAPGATGAQPPQISDAQASSAAVGPGGTVTFSLTATDPNTTPSPISFNWSTAGLGSLSGQSGSATSSSITWSAPSCLPASGTTISVRVTDAYQLSSSQTFTVLPADGELCPSLTINNSTPLSGGSPFTLTGSCVNPGDRVLWGWSSSTSSWSSSWVYAGQPFNGIGGSGMTNQASCGAFASGLDITIPAGNSSFFIWESDYGASVISTDLIVPVQ